jgi:hypothetical protein
MSWRFRKSFKVLPGVRLNLTRRGLSATVGAAPFSVNIGPRGVYRNISIPGTGLWNRERLDAPSADRSIPTSESVPHIAPTSSPELFPALPQPSYLPTVDPANEIRSASTELLNSESMNEFRDLLRHTYDERTTLEAELASANRELNFATEKYRRWERGFLLKHVFKRIFAERKESFETAQAKVSEFSEQLHLTKLATHFEIDREQAEPYFRLRDEFAALSGCQKIWDTLSRQAINHFVTRSAASEAITREAVQFELSSSDLLQWEQKVPHLPNRIGGDLYIYPGFVLYRASKQAFALIDFHDVKAGFQPTRFIEDGPIPSDTQVVGQAWAKSNKDGSPDRRFSGNYQIPIVSYGEVIFTSPSGLHEEYQFSNPALAQRFVNAWDSFQKSFASPVAPQGAAIQLPTSPSPQSSGEATAVKSLTIELLRLISMAIAGLHTPPENKNADEYLRAELLHLVLHFAALDGQISKGEARVYGEITSAIDPNTRESVENNVILLKGLMNVWGKEELGRPRSLSLIEQFDQENKTDRKIEGRDAFFQIALAVASADGLPSAAVKTELLRFAQILGQAAS